MQIRLTFFDVILFAAMVVGFVIGIHQSIYYGVVNAYWLFMLSTLAFLWLNHRLKKKKQLAENTPAPTLPNRKKDKAKKK